jgi:hypothetical protein
MKKLLLFGIVGLFSMSSFAAIEPSAKPEPLFYPKVHVYCDGVYAGYFYNVGYSTMEIVEMANSMCDQSPQQ